MSPKTTVSVEEDHHFNYTPYVQRGALSLSLSLSLSVMTRGKITKQCGII